MSRHAFHYFWSDWPEDSQRRFFKLLVVGSLVLSLCVFVGFKLVGGSVEQEIAQAKEQYGRVFPLVQDVIALRAQMGNLSHLPVEEALWFIVDDLAIESQLTSIRSTQLEENVTGIQATFTGLPQSKMSAFLFALRERASLQTPECVLSRNPDDPRLADLHLVLAR